MLKKIDAVLSALEGGINGALLLSSTILLFINIILRHFFKSSTTWAEEAIRYAIIWVTFFGSSLCAKNGLHVGIDIFAEMLPKNMTKYVLATAQIFGAIFTAFLAFFGWRLTWLIIETGQRSPAMEIPMWITYIAIPLGGFLMTIRFIVAAIEELKKKPELEEACEIDLSRL